MTEAKITTPCECRGHYTLRTNRQKQRGESYAAVRFLYVLDSGSREAEQLGLDAGDPQSIAEK